MGRYVLRLKCPKCGQIWATYFEAEGPLDPEGVVVVRCAYHGGPFRIRLNMLKPAGEIPEGVTPVRLGDSSSQGSEGDPGGGRRKRRWWWFW